MHSYRVLHPRVCHKNPDCGDICAYCCKPGGCKVESLAYFIPSKVHYCKEGALHKEGYYTLYCQRRAKDVAHKPAVIAPVRAELELQNDARGHANSEVDAEQTHPEFRNLLPPLRASAIINALHNRHNHAETQRERHKEPVVDGRQRKLPARPVNSGH